MLIRFIYLLKLNEIINSHRRNDALISIFNDKLNSHYNLSQIARYIFYFMKKSGTFEEESSLSNRSSSSKKQYLDTQEEEATQKKENFGSIFYLSHLIQKIVSIKTSNSFDMILCSMRSHRKL